MSKIIDGIAKDLKAIPETLKAKTGSVDKKKLILMNLPYILAGYFCDKIAWLWRVSPGSNASDKMMAAMNGLNDLFSNPPPSFFPKDLLIGIAGGYLISALTGIMIPDDYVQGLLYDFRPYSITYTLIKMAVFAFIITSISAFYGYYAKGNSLEVGAASTKAVVASSIVIMIFNLILTQILLI